MIRFRKYVPTKKLLGLMIYYLISFLHKSMRLKIVCHPDFNLDNQYIFVFWHGKQLLPALIKKYHTKQVVALVSPSLDGDIWTMILNKLGYHAIRGSSRKNNTWSLKKMAELEQHYSLALAIDGPAGPIYKTKPGTRYLANENKMPIVPVGSAFNQKWVMNKLWDKFEIPKPFSKAVLYIGKPLDINEENDSITQDIQIEQATHNAEATALAILNDPEMLTSWVAMIKRPFKLKIFMR